jgi:hypothetical protein
MEHCLKDRETYDSFGVPCHAEAMRLLAEAGFIDITSETGDRIQATMVPQAKSFLDCMDEDRPSRHRDAEQVEP